MVAPKIAQLRRMSDDDLIAKHDEAVDKVGSEPGVSYYLEELARRGQVRQADDMLGYTRRMDRMTLVVTIATIINLMATIVNVVIAFLRR